MPGSGSPSSYRCGRSPTKRARRSEGGSLTPLKNIDDPRQRSRIDAVVNDHATPARQHNLHPARRLNRARRGWRVLRGLNTFRERRPTAGRRLAADHCLRKHRAIVDLDKTPLSGQTAPREQLARRQSIQPRRRRYLPPPIVALAPDQDILFHRPTTPGTSLDHLKSRHLRHSRMISHTPMSSPPHPSHKAVLSAGIRFLERAITFYPGQVAACCGNPATGLIPVIAPFKGGELSSEILMAGRESIIARHKGGDIVPECKGCPRPTEEGWNRSGA